MRIGAHSAISHCSHVTTNISHWLKCHHGSAIKCILLGMVWVQTVRKGYQQTTKVASSQQRLQTKQLVDASFWLKPWFKSLESPYHLVAVSGAHFTQGTILIVILVSSGSAKSRTHQSAVGGFLVTRRGWPGRLRACRIWTFINSV